MPTEEINIGSEDRRRRLRFSFHTELRYEVLVKAGAPQIKGVGQLQDMSSMAVAFRAEEPLMAKMRLKISMMWPSSSHETRLGLVFEGKVLRTSGDLTVVSISRYEFRTASKGSAAREETGEHTQALFTR